jgi:hypothetical protein
VLRLAARLPRETCQVLSRVQRIARAIFSDRTPIADDSVRTEFTTGRSAHARDRVTKVAVERVRDRSPLLRLPGVSWRRLSTGSDSQRGGSQTCQMLSRTEHRARDFVSIGRRPQTTRSGPSRLARLRLRPARTEERLRPRESPGNVMTHLIPGRGIPPRGVAPPSNMANILSRRAWRAGRRAPGLRQAITFPGD